MAKKLIRRGVVSLLSAVLLCACGPAAIELTTSSEFPHASATAVPSSWLPDLLDTSDTSPVAEEARLTYQQWRENGVPQEKWREYFLCTRVPGAGIGGALYIVQPGWDPSPRQFHGAHASRFWVVRADDTITTVFVNAVVDAIDVRIPTDGTPPILTLVWMYANRVEELELQYDAATSAYVGRGKRGER